MTTKRWLQNAHRWYVHTAVRGISRVSSAACPAFNEELQRDLDEGKVIFGGCEVEGIYPLPRYHCNDCEEEF